MQGNVNFVHKVGLTFGLLQFSNQLQHPFFLSKIVEVGSKVGEAGTLDPILCTKLTYMIVPSLIRALTKSRSKSTPRVKVNTRHCLDEETPSASVVKRKHRQGKASPRWRRRPTRASPDKTLLKQGNHSAAPRYPWVGKTMEGATPWEGLKSR